MKAFKQFNTRRQVGVAREFCAATVDRGEWFGRGLGKRVQLLQDVKDRADFHQSTFLYWQCQEGRLNPIRAVFF